MANNVLIPGAGAATAATDEVGGAHYQLVKLVGGAEDSTARIDGDATNGLDVDVTRAPSVSNTAAAVPSQATMVGGTDGTNLRAIKVTAGGVVETIARCSTAALTNVAASVTSVTLLSANTARCHAVIVNDSTAATLYVKFGATASTSSYTYRLSPGGTLELANPVYTGRVDGIWNVASGNARITEVTD